MQALTASPRDQLSEQQVRSLLTVSGVVVQSGLELIRPDLSVADDLSSTLIGGSVERNLFRVPHGKCDLTLDAPLVWGVDLVRPWMRLTHPAGTVSALFYLGVFCLTTPDEEVDDSDSPVWKVTGWDRLHLLRREVGDSYQVPAGTGVLAAVRAAITAAGLSGVALDGTAEAATVPTTMSYPLVRDTVGGDSGGETGPATWLRIVNDLLSLVNYRGIYCDEVGRFRSQPYVEPAARPVEYLFDASDPLTLIGEERTRQLDVWATPNRWVFIRRNMPTGVSPAVGAGIVVLDNVSDGPTSQTARGLLNPATYTVDAADQTALEGLAQRRKELDLRATELYEVSTAPFPPAGHADVFGYLDAAFSHTTARKVQATSWRYTLDGSDVRWTWEAVA